MIRVYGLCDRALFAMGCIILHKLITIFFFMLQSSFAAEVMCSTILTELCACLPFKLYTNQGIWRNMLFALWLLNKTVMSATDHVKK